jgi:cell division septation protein DedD
MKRNNSGRNLLVCTGIAAMLMAVSVVSAPPPAPRNDVIVDVMPDSQTGMPGDTLIYTVSATNNGTVSDIIVVDSITGVSAGWTIELKDTAVPQTLPYQTPLLASKTSYLLTVDVHIPANAAVDTAMTINIHSYANHSVTDRDTFECVASNNAPVLSSGKVSPASGNLSTIYTYSVNYTDADNDPPDSIYVTIGGAPHPMNVSTGQDGNYTNGVVYEYDTTGTVIGSGSHTFQFNTSDGIDYATGDIAVHSGPITLDTDLSNVELIYTDPTVTSINVYSLNLSEINTTYKPARVTPQSAYMINSTGAGNFTLRFTGIPNANTITTYKINATNHWIPLDMTTTTDTVTFTMDARDLPVVFGAVSAAHHPGGDDGTYPTGWFETPAPAVIATPAETATPVSTEKPAMTPTEAPTPSTAVPSSPTETPTTKLPTKGIPGFKSVYMIAGILVAAYLTLRRR